MKCLGNLGFLEFVKILEGWGLKKFALGGGGLNVLQVVNHSKGMVLNVPKPARHYWGCRGSKTRIYILLALEEEVSVAPGVLAVLAGVAITNTPLVFHPRRRSLNPTVSQNSPSNLKRSKSLTSMISTTGYRRSSSRRIPHRPIPIPPAITVINTYSAGDIDGEISNCTSPIYARGEIRGSHRLQVGTAVAVVGGGPFGTAERGIAAEGPA